MCDRGGQSRAERSSPGQAAGCTVHLTLARGASCHYLQASHTAAERGLADLTWQMQQARLAAEAQLQQLGVEHAQLLAEVAAVKTELGLLKQGALLDHMAVSK